MSHHLIVPDNITLLPLPAKCPDLNPVGNMWQFIRDNGLSNRGFTNHDDIVDHCCDAWNRLCDCPFRLTSIGLSKVSSCHFRTVTGWRKSGVPPWWCRIVAGLPVASTLRASKLATVELDHVIRVAGCLSAADQNLARRALLACAGT